VIRFLRHAEAGSRRLWNGPDRERPLTDEGSRRAEAVAALLSADGVSRILSSPYARCLQSVEPLAKATGLTVEIDPALAEGADPREVRALLWRVEPGTVLCSHGDVAADLIGGLTTGGADLDGTLAWEKGSIWNLERAPGGRITRGRYLPPPPIA